MTDQALSTARKAANALARMLTDLNLSPRQREILTSAEQIAGSLASGYGSTVDDGLTDLSIHTRNPGKWVIVDTETRQIWKWDIDKTWVLASLSDLQYRLQANVHPCRGCGRKPEEHPAPDCEGWY